MQIPQDSDPNGTTGLAEKTQTTEEANPGFWKLVLITIVSVITLHSPETKPIFRQARRGKKGLAVTFLVILAFAFVVACIQLLPKLIFREKPQRAVHSPVVIEQNNSTNATINSAKQLIQNASSAPIQSQINGVEYPLC